MGALRSNLPRDDADVFVDRLTPKQFEQLRKMLNGQAVGDAPLTLGRAARKLVIEPLKLGLGCLGLAVLVAAVVAGVSELSDNNVAVLVVIMVLLACSAIGWGITTSVVKRHVKHLLRQRCGNGYLPQCLECGYSTQGLSAPLCPECGSRVRWSFPVAPADNQAQAEAATSALEPAQALEAARDFVASLSRPQRDYLCCSFRHHGSWFRRHKDAMPGISLMMVMLALAAAFGLSPVSDWAERHHTAAVNVALAWALLWIMPSVIAACWTARREAIHSLLHHCPSGLLPECAACGCPTHGLPASKEHCPACGAKVRWRTA